MKTEKVNVLIIGNGHYATGCTVLDGMKKTDKDFGIILPSVLELRRQGRVDEIFLAARNGNKFHQLKQKMASLKQLYSWDTSIHLFPQNGFGADCYKEVLQQIPKPAVAMIAVPDNLHKQMMLDCIDAGVHFLVVKPAVVNQAQLDEVLNAKSGKPLLGMVDYHKVFDDANMLLKQQLQQRKLGQIYHVFSRMSQRRDMLEIFAPWLGSSTTNVNHYLGAHYIHMTGFLTDATPLSVRSTGQFGIVKNKYNIDSQDMIQTQVTWKHPDGYDFVSYHLASWTDPSNTPAMTYQEIGVMGTEGNVYSDQRFRGFESQLADEGFQTVNPYFFNLNHDYRGMANLDSKYGFKSIKTFVEAALEIENGQSSAFFDDKLPSIAESKRVTAILEAADRSLQENSQVIDL